MRKNSRARFDWRYLFLLPIPLLWSLLAYYGFLDRVENQFLDLRFRARGEIEAPVKLIYVDVDTRAIQQLGQFPWSREKFAIAAKALVENGGARAVGFDFVFSALTHSELVDQKEVARGNQVFHQVIRRHPNIVLAVQYTIGQALTQNEETARRLPLIRLGMTDRTKNDVPEMPQWPLVGPTWGRVGLIDFDSEYGGDAVPRWVPMFAHTMNPTLYHLSLQLVLLSLGLDEQAVKIFSDRLEIVSKTGSVVLAIPLREQQLVEVNWFSKWINPDLNPRVSVTDVLGFHAKLASENPAERAEAEEYFNWFRGAIVLIGPTDALLQDLAPTGLERAPVPKVGVHGNMVKTILSGKFLQHAPPWVGTVTVFLLTFGVSYLAMTGGTRAMWFKLAAVGLVFAYVALCLLFFKEGHVVLAMAAPLGASLSTSFVGVIWQLLIEEKQKGRIKGMFSTYLAPQVVDKLLESGEVPQLGGHEEEITAYFSDIQGFSAFSESLPPAKLVQLMNEYLTACTDIVVEGQGGTLDKYIGDAIVAFFGAPVVLPDHAYRACVASQLVHHRLAELRAKWQSEGDRWPEIVWRMQSRIGLNSGAATIGNMGSPTRFNYTMMGDNVNLAARMESGAKQYGVYTMVTESTKLACEKHGGGRVVFRYLEKIVVKGRSMPVPIYEIVGLKENVIPQTQECLEIFGRGMERYLAQDWTGAEADFTRSAGLEPNQPGKNGGVEINPSLALLTRCRYLREHPPGAAWSGVYVMKEK